MKAINIKYIAIGAVLTLSMISCSDYLDREPFSDIQSEDFYTTEKNIDLAAVGMYGTLRTFYQNYVVLSELPADNAYTTSGGADNLGQLDKFSAVGLNNLLSNAWNNSYQSILQTNKVLSALPNISFNSEVKKAQIEGEARFIRALTYFNLVRMFGKVPLVLKVINQEEARKLIRSDEQAVYQLIIDDLIASSTLLPNVYSGNNIGRATRWAALSLLGKVYLTRRQFTEALVPLQEVVERGPYALLPNFADIFEPGNANHRESVFEIQYEGGTLGMGSRWSSAAHPRQLANALGISTADETLPTNDIVQAFEAVSGELTSPRYLATIGTLQYQNAGGATLSAKHVKKHFMENTIQNQSDDNWPLIRFADVMMMYAETLNETSATPPAQAVALVNQIRRRAFGLSVGGGDASKDLDASATATQQAFRDAIYLERRLELAFEGHRWYDLVRTERYVTVMNNHFIADFNGSFKVESYHRLFPVPQREIDINPLLRPNNEGYN
jgi:hypothetical protein